MILKKEIVDQLSKELSLPFTGMEQDWDLEMANSDRVDDFLKFYQENDLSTDKKVALIALILASYEDFLNENDLKIDARWEKIRSVLKSEKIILSDLISYWALNNETEDDDLFRLTPLLRGIEH